jgi:hypothetical protein
MKCYLPAALAAGLLTLALRPAPGADKESLKPVNLDKVNTAADEDDPFLAPGGLHLYYVSNRAGNFNLMVAHRTRLSQLWPAGKKVKELNHDKESDRRSPFLTPKGKFYFASNAVPNDPNKKFARNFDLLHSLKYSYRDPFTQPTPVLALATEADELHPWVTSSGREFYFSRKTEEGWRVFVARGPATGGIDEPKPVDLPTGFHHATISPNGLTMYLQGPLAKGRWGLFRTTRVRIGAAWGKPVELSELNSADGPRGDMSPSLSSDGTKLYFASDRPGGKGGLDLWMIPVAKLNKS